MIAEKKKLTLSIEQRLIQAAKEYAEKNNTTVSKLVSTLFEKIEQSTLDADSETPIFDRLAGSLAGIEASDVASIEDYEAYLAEKYDVAEAN